MFSFSPSKIFHGKGNQQESHLRNLILMANSDNSISKSEIEAIYEIGIKRGISRDRIKSILRDTKEIELFIPDNGHDKFEQIYDLVIVMLADGVIEDYEMNFCTNIANKFGFRKTISALIVIRITQGIKEKLSKKQIKELCKDYL